MDQAKEAGGTEGALACDIGYIYQHREAARGPQDAIGYRDSCSGVHVLAVSIEQIGRGMLRGAVQSVHHVRPAFLNELSGTLLVLSRVVPFLHNAFDHALERVENDILPWK